ncbi:MAG: DNA mismatch repair protein MutS [Boseongicola sp. SB0664_bin_43]|uniref:DNA mismatch repair protein MutS n=1 Tax=Boseongicola sp. SB0664_bin_43 TaxID=2604844 RepID=A0A6B0Y1T2_9RHOB|nr:DNA mismatch repair protein MutS [Boseongicola sp. SB0664_bin_43]
MSRKPRVLSPEEERLWQHVAGGTKPLDKKRARKVPQAIPKKRPRPEKSEAFEIPEFRVGERAASSPAAMPDASRATIRMDPRKFTRMKRGKTAPDTRIDLHGKTASEGRAALVSFLLRAHEKGHRTVLVITGKGRERGDAGPIPQRPGILRQQLPRWVSSAPLDQIVLQCTEAHPRHGGSGAFYVYLSRRR